MYHQTRLFSRFFEETADERILQIPSDYTLLNLDFLSNGGIGKTTVDWNERWYIEFADEAPRCNIRKLEDDNQYTRRAKVTRPMVENLHDIDARKSVRQDLGACAEAYAMHR